MNFTKEKKIKYSEDQKSLELTKFLIPSPYRLFIEDYATATKLYSRFTYNEITAEANTRIIWRKVKKVYLSIVRTLKCGFKNEPKDYVISYPISQTLAAFKKRGKIEGKRINKMGKIQTYYFKNNLFLLFKNQIGL